MGQSSWCNIFVTLSYLPVYIMNIAIIDQGSWPLTFAYITMSR